MAEQFINEPMLDMYIFESTQNIEQLELLILETEKTACYTPAAINEIFRIMHTIKGSSAMMLFNNISNLAHKLEDVFYYLREKKPQDVDCSTLSDLVLEGVDFIKVELYKIRNGDDADGDASALVDNIAEFLVQLRRNSQPEAQPERQPSSEEPAEKPDEPESPKFYIATDKTKAAVVNNAFKAVIFFDDGCEMENVRAFTIIHNLKEFTENLSYFPENIIESDDSIGEIRKNGFKIFFKTGKSIDDIKNFFQQVAFLRDIELVQVKQQDDAGSLWTPETQAPEAQAPETQAPESLTPEAQAPEAQTPEALTPEAQTPEAQAPETQAPESLTPEAQAPKAQTPESQTPESSPVIASVKPDNNSALIQQTKAAVEKANEPDIQLNTAQSIISVNVAKLDKLMDLVGEMVIAEAMVTQNPEILELELESFLKASRQLRKITNELQDTVMSIRMVPLTTTFQKMHRIVRDMCKRLGKDVKLALLGEETEVDKNIIEHISDPLMHLVRNSLDHGIESEEERAAKGKPLKGTVTLEAMNAGSDVLIIVKDDGRGLNKEKILKKARGQGLLSRPEAEMTDKEIYNLMFLPGFSTKENVTEFSGRGVGMDVVTRSIEAVGGSVLVESTQDVGATIILKIPLTLAIIDGMNIRVGKACYTIPITAIRESFRPKANELITDPDGHEMIMVRERCYPIIRLHEYFGVNADVSGFEEGILVMVEQEGKAVCLFADELLGQQQVVVKALPDYIKNVRKINSLAGCTILGDGSISLIIDIVGFIN